MIPSVTPENLVDAARGLYWFCAHCHDGQHGALLRIQSRLNYAPGMGEAAPDPADATGEDCEAAEIYAALEPVPAPERAAACESLLAAIQSACRAAH